MIPDPQKTAPDPSPWLYLEVYNVTLGFGCADVDIKRVYDGLPEQKTHLKTVDKHCSLIACEQNFLEFRMTFEYPISL